jgi:hypothetical protein
MISFGVVVVLGGLLSVAELISRYRDDPARAVWSLPAALYVGVNCAASAAALWLIREFGWTFGATGATSATVQVLVAGFGAAALFRSSLFNMTVGDQIVGVGPAAILNVILSAADRAVDRKRARIRFEKTSEIMRDISFADHAESLVLCCWAAMQNASSVEIKAIDDQMLSLRSKTEGVPDQVKSLVLGLALQTVVGDRVLREAAQRLAAFASPEKPPGTTPAAAPDATRMLRTIATRGPVPVRVLQETCSMSLGPFNRLLRQLTEAGSIAVQGEPGKEVVSIVGPPG